MSAAALCVVVAGAVVTVLPAPAPVGHAAPADATASGTATATGTAAAPPPAFTLAWTHSVERVRWEEHWQVAGDRLVLTEARVRGSGAGMEPGPEARLVDGSWRWRPELPPVPQIALPDSEFAGDYTLCVASRCHPLQELAPHGPGQAVVLRPCHG